MLRLPLLLRDADARFITPLPGDATPSPFRATLPFLPVADTILFDMPLAR